MSISSLQFPCRFEGKGQFIRKGQVGDWRNHFTPQLNKVLNSTVSDSTSSEQSTVEFWLAILVFSLQEYNSWILENLDRIGVTDLAIRGFFSMDEQL